MNVAITTDSKLLLLRNNAFKLVNNLLIVPHHYQPPLSFPNTIATYQLKFFHCQVRTDNIIYLNSFSPKSMEFFTLSDLYEVDCIIFIY